MVVLEQTPLRPLSGSRSAPSLAARTPSRLQSTLSTPAGRLLSEQLLVHLHRAERPRQSASAENPQAIPLHASGALGGRPMSNTQLPTIVGGLLRAQRSKFLDRDLARDNTQERYSKERLLESNFGGRSLTRLVQRAKSLSSLQEAEQQARRDIAISSKHTADRRTASAAQELAAAIARGSPLSHGAAGMMGPPRQPARRPRPRRLEIVAGLQTGPELRSKARGFLASSETLLARRERAEQAAAAKGLAHQPHHHHHHNHNHQQSQEGFGASGLGASGTAASGVGTGGPLGGTQSIPPQGSRPPSRAQTPAQTAAQTAEEAEEERRVLEKYNE